MGLVVIQRGPQTDCCISYISVAKIKEWVKRATPYQGMGNASLLRSSSCVE